MAGDESIWRRRREWPFAPSEEMEMVGDGDEGGVAQPRLRGWLIFGSCGQRQHEKKMGVDEVHELRLYVRTDDSA